MTNHGLYERDVALETISTCIATAGSGHGCIVLVSGEAGIGKTALVNEVVGRHAAKVLSLIGYCDASSTPQPLGPLADFAGKLNADIARLLNSSEPPQALFPSIINAIYDSKKTVLMVIEDAHWADGATLDLVRYLGRRVAAARLVLVLSYRNDEVGVNHPLTSVLGNLPPSMICRIGLDPLSQDAIGLLSGTDKKDALRLYNLTGGNPLFLTELMAHGGLSGVLPTSIRDAVWARLAKISEDEREVLGNLSIVPVPLEPELASALGKGRNATISDLVHRGLLRKNSNGNLIFRHELARLATLEAMLPTRLSELHELAEITLAGMNQDESVGLLTRRVHHAQAAGNGNKVLSIAPLAAAEAKRLGAHEEAATLLGLALTHVKLAGKEQAAQLYQDYAYEVGLSKKIGDEAIGACKKAIALWQELKRPDKMSRNYRQLSRLHWYRGETKQAEEYGKLAEAALVDLEEGAEQAMIFSARSQALMLHDDCAGAIAWGEKAMTLARKFDDQETLTHALNNVGTAMLAQGNLQGHIYLQQSLDLALRHGFHEQAARAYTNHSEAAFNLHDLALAERLYGEGIAFDTNHDLDSWTHYLSGGFARLRLEQGRFAEAVVIANGILALDHLTLIMKLPAKIALGIAKMRLGQGDEQLLEALADGEVTGEPQYLIPCLLALAESAWLDDDLARARERLAQARSSGPDLGDSWRLGEILVWGRRFDVAPDAALLSKQPAMPREAEMRGDFKEAARLWDELGSPYQAALALAQSINGQHLSEALMRLEDLEARSATHWLKRRAAALGLSLAMPHKRRGPYRAARGHPYGLTHKEVLVLNLLSKGQGNLQISKTLSRSQRTVEHHVASILAKLNTRNRVEVILRAQAEPWILQPVPQ